MTNIKQEINSCFVKPSTKEDLLQIIYNMQSWLQIAYTNLHLRKEKEASEISLAVLDGIGKHYCTDSYNNYECDTEIKDCCANAAYIVSTIMSNLSTRNDIKILTLFELQQIANHKVFSEYQLINLKKMAEDQGVFQFESNWKPSFAI